MNPRLTYTDSEWILRVPKRGHGVSFELMGAPVPGLTSGSMGAAHALPEPSCECCAEVSEVLTRRRLENTIGAHLGRQLSEKKISTGSVAIKTKKKKPRCVNCGKLLHKDLRLHREPPFMVHCYESDANNGCVPVLVSSSSPCVVHSVATHAPKQRRAKRYRALVDDQMRRYTSIVPEPWFIESVQEGEGVAFGITREQAERAAKLWNKMSETR